MKIFKTTSKKFYSQTFKSWVEQTELRLFGFKIWTENHFVEQPSESVEMIEYRAVESLRNERGRAVDYSQLPALSNTAFDQFQQNIYPTRF